MNSVTGSIRNAMSSGIIGKEKEPAPSPRRSVNPSNANGIVPDTVCEATGIIIPENKYGRATTLTMIKLIKAKVFPQKNIPFTFANIFKYLRLRIFDKRWVEQGHV